MQIELAIEQINLQLAKLDTLDLGYPLGANVVRPTSHPNGLPESFLSIGGSHWLAQLYSVCDGLSFPDVHDGYFLKLLSRLLCPDRSSEPNIVLLEQETDVLPFGSTGDGSLLVVECRRGSVMLLPPGPVFSGKYHATGAGGQEVAATVPRFVERLLSDVTAFVCGDQEHRFLA